MFTSAKTEMILAAVENPFDGVTPSLDVFGKEFDSKAVLILGGIWALALLFCAAALVWNGAKWSFAKRQGQVVDGETASSHFFTALWATCAVVGVPLIVGAVIWILR